MYIKLFFLIKLYPCDTEAGGIADLVGLVDRSYYFHV